MIGRLLGIPPWQLLSHGRPRRYSISRFHGSGYGRSFPNHKRNVFGPRQLHGLKDLSDTAEFCASVGADVDLVLGALLYSVANAERQLRGSHLVSTKEDISSSHHSNQNCIRSVCFMQISRMWHLRKVYRPAQLWLQEWPHLRQCKHREQRQHDSRERRHIDLTDQPQGLPPLSSRQ
jgi:hypothetical protein